MKLHEILNHKAQSASWIRRNSRFLSVILLTFPFVLEANGLEKSYHFAAPTVRDGKIVMAGCHTAATAFGPSVAVHAVQLLLPPGKTVSNITAVYGKAVSLPGSYSLQEVIPPTPKSHGPFPKRLSKRSGIFTKNAFFPGVNGTAPDFTVQYKNGAPILCTTVYPSEYNPVTGAIRYYPDVTLNVETIPDVKAPPLAGSPVLAGMVAAVVENPEAAAALAAPATNPGDYEYLIACKTAFKSSFTEFVKFNTRRGLRTKIFSVDDIKSIGGADLQEKLRNLIKQEYAAHHINYVLIASNDQHNDPLCIPHRGFSAKFYDHDTIPAALTVDDDIPSDMYYACLDGDWKTDKTGTVRTWGWYGTEDIGAEVYVGRFCVATTAQLTNMIAKTIAYAEKPVLTGGITNVMLAGEFLWDDAGALCTGTQNLNALKGYSNVNGYATYGFPADTWSVIEVSHEKDPYWTSGAWQLRDSLFYSGIARQQCAWVDHDGHTSTQMAIGTVSSASSPFYSGGTLPLLSDTTWKKCDGKNANHFFMVSEGCFCGSFDNLFSSGTPGDYCTGECWSAVASSLATGPVAILANSRFGLGDNDGTDGASDRPVRWFHDALFNPAKQIHYAGQMLANARETDARRITLADVPNQDFTKDTPYWGALKYTNYELNLFGDPALSLWTAAPVTLAPQPKLTGSVLTLDTKGPYSWVALANDKDSIFITRQTGLDGRCVIDDPLLAAYVASNPYGTLKVRVKSHNFLPDSATVKIGAGVMVGSRASAIKSFGIKIDGSLLYVNFSLSEASPAFIRLYNAKGVEVALPINKPFGRGAHAESLSLASLGDGVYFCSLLRGGERLTAKFSIVR
jgi:hypothetical protein